MYIIHTVLEIPSNSISLYSDVRVPRRQPLIWSFVSSNTRRARHMADAQSWSVLIGWTSLPHFPSNPWGICLPAGICSLENNVLWPIALWPWNSNRLKQKKNMCLQRLKCLWGKDFREFYSYLASAINQGIRPCDLPSLEIHSHPKSYGLLEFP